MLKMDMGPTTVLICTMALIWDPCPLGLPEMLSVAYMDRAESVVRWGPHSGFLRA